MNTTLQNAIISAIGTVASLAAGFGLFSNTTEQAVVAAAGTLVSLGFLIAGELRAKTQVTAAVALKDNVTLARYSK